MSWVVHSADSIRPTSRAGPSCPGHFSFLRRVDYTRSDVGPPLGCRRPELGPRVGRVLGSRPFSRAQARLAVRCRSILSSPRQGDCPHIAPTAPLQPAGQVGQLSSETEKGPQSPASSPPRRIGPTGRRVTSNKKTGRETRLSRGESARPPFPVRARTPRAPAKLRSHKGDMWRIELLTLKDSFWEHAFRAPLGFRAAPDPKQVWASLPPLASARSGIAVEAFSSRSYVGVGQGPPDFARGARPRIYAGRRQDPVDHFPSELPSAPQKRYVETLSVTPRLHLRLDGNFRSSSAR